MTEPNRIPDRIFQHVAGADGTAFVSAVTIWEIAIKYRLGRRDTPFSSHEAIGHFQSAGFSLLDVTAAHAAFVERLPLLHGDPFDRLMIAQAIFENMQLVTYDRHLSRYGVAMLTWS